MSTENEKIETFERYGCTVTPTAKNNIYLVESGQEPSIQIDLGPRGQRYRIVGSDKWESYKRSDHLIRLVWSSEKKKRAGSACRYFVGEQGFKTKETLTNYARGLVRGHGTRRDGFMLAHADTFFRELATVAGSGYPERLQGKVMKVGSNSVGNGLEITLIDDVNDHVDTISYHKMIRLVPLTESKPARRAIFTPPVVKPVAEEMIPPVFTRDDLLKRQQEEFQSFDDRSLQKLRDAHAQKMLEFKS